MNSTFQNEYLQLAAIIIATLGTVATASLPLIISQTNKQTENYKAKSKNFNATKKLLEKYIKTTEAVVAICQATRESSKYLEPNTDKAKIASYYQGIIYQVEEKLSNIESINETK